MTSIEQASATALEVAGATVTETSLKLTRPEELGWDAYQQLGEFLGTVGRAYPWWVGDFLNYGEDIFGEEFAQIEASLPHSPQTLKNYKSVARYLPRTRRKQGLPYSVQAEVAYLEPRERDRWLNEAEAGGWKREEMRERLRAARALPGPVGEQAVTGSGEGVTEHEGSQGGPHGPVPGPVTCPNCGHSFDGARGD